MLLIFIVVLVCGAAPLTHAQDHVQCFNINYNGPIAEIIKSDASKLAFGTTKASGAALEFAKNLATLKAIELASAQIENIPVAGAILASLFGALVEKLGEGEDVIETVYKELKAEIDNLKKYVDQRIEVLSVDIIRKAFGTERGGILGYANHCQKTYKGDAKDIVHCLENLRAMLIQQYHFFIPESDDIASFEQTLPLFRMYGQLFVDTLLEQISVAERRGKVSQAASHVEALKKRVAEFKTHAENAVSKIIRAQAVVHVSPKKDNPNCAGGGNIVSICICTVSIGPNEFDVVDKDGKPTDKTKNYCTGISVNTYGICGTTINMYKRKYRREHVEAILSYWRKQLGNAVDNWEKTAITVGKIAEEHKRSLPLLERIQFESDVERTIAKENQMRKRMVYSNPA